MRFSALSALAVSIPLVLSGAEAVSSFAGEENGAPKRDLADAPQHGPARPRPQGRPASAPANPADAPSTARVDSDKLCIIPRPDRPPAAPFPQDLEWIRTSGMPPEEAMRGRVVLIEVWESSCINCLRNLPILNQLSRRYAANGLLVLGIHSSEFSFTASRIAVERA